MRLLYREMNRNSLDGLYTERYNACLMDNRMKILAKALELFSTYGYESVGVQRIAEEAGVTKPTLYHYFGSKTGLLNTLLESYFSHLFSRLEVATKYNQDLTLTLQKTASVYFNFAVENRVFYRMILSLWFAPLGSDAHQAVRVHNQQQQEMIETVFQQAIEQHGNMKGYHQSIAASFLGQINTYAGLLINGLVELDDQLEHRILHQFMHGIFS